MIVNTPHKVAVVLGTYNRGKLLRRALRKYGAFNLQLVVMDDGSTDETKIFCEFSAANIHYFYLGDKTGYRDSASYLNKGIKYALDELKASHVYITHPEIIIGNTTLIDCVEYATDDNTWVSFKGYYLTPEQQVIAQTQWDTITAEIVSKHFPNFYGSAQSAEFTGNPDYTPEAIEAAPVWHSWIFAGGSAAMWRRFGGLTPFETWGSVDVDLLNRRNIGGIRTVTPQALSSYVVHQNHDDNAQRDMAKCMAALPVYTSPEQAFKPELLQ